MSESKSLLTDLKTVGDALTQSELPSSADALHVLGAVIKVLENKGIEVADELLKPPEPAPTAAVPPQAAAPAAPAGATVPAAADSSRLDRIERALAKLLDKDADDAAPSSAPSPAPSTPASSSSGASGSSS